MRLPAAGHGLPVELLGAAAVQQVLESVSYAQAAARLLSCHGQERARLHHRSSSMPL